MDKNFRLNKRARQWIDGIRRHYEGQPLAAEVPQIAEPAFKMM